jgi:monooxygenase
MYKGMMIEDVPNFALSMGYTNASWTLKSDLTCEFVCRLLARLDDSGMRQVTPRQQRGRRVPAVPLLDFTSGYVQRGIGRFPQQGAEAPWRVYQNYARDLLMLRYGKLDDGVLTFSNRSMQGAREPEQDNASRSRSSTASRT